MSDDAPSKGPERATGYVPRYVNIDDVPIKRENTDVGMPTGGVDNTTKRFALKEAEAQFENDVNDGQPLVTTNTDADADADADTDGTADLPGGTWAAVRNLASAAIYHPALDPREGINLNEVSEYGEQQFEYVGRFVERYNTLVASINASDDDPDSGDELSVTVI